MTYPLKRKLELIIIIPLLQVDIDRAVDLIVIAESSELQGEAKAVSGASGVKVGTPELARVVLRKVDLPQEASGTSGLLEVGQSVGVRPESHRGLT